MHDVIAVAAVIWLAEFDGQDEHATLPDADFHVLTAHAAENTQIDGTRQWKAQLTAGAAVRSTAKPPIRRHIRRGDQQQWLADAYVHPAMHVH